MVNAIRAVLDVQRVQQLLSQNALVVRGTPDQIALAEKLVEDLDKARPEVIVDIAVMQVSKDRSRTLGLSPPTSATVTLQSNINTTRPPRLAQRLPARAPPSPKAPDRTDINLNTLGNLNATNFQVAIPSANLSAVMNNSDTKLIQNPQIRALDGQKASLKIGDRVPVATGSFQPGIGGVGINPLVNTQFQYLDVGVNIDITPHVHANGEVTLKITMDVSAVTGQSNIGGISQPIIGQRKIEHEIRLKDGEANLLGGIMEDQQTKSLAGIPGLAQIPILRYLFGQTTQDHSENEIVFAIVPHIIRGTEVSESTSVPIDIGTATTIELRHASQAASRSGARAAPTKPATQPPGNPAPATQPPASNPAAAEPPASSLIRPPFRRPRADTFVVNLLLSGAQNVHSVPVQLNYDPKMLQLVNVSNGGFLSQDGQAVALVHREDETVGQSQITATRPPGAGGVSGQGAVVTITFQAKADWPDPSDHHTRRSSRSGLTAHHGQRSASVGHDPVRGSVCNFGLATVKQHGEATTGTTTRQQSG